MSIIPEENDTKIIDAKLKSKNDTWLVPFRNQLSKKKENEPVPQKAMDFSHLEPSKLKKFTPVQIKKVRVLTSKKSKSATKYSKK
jgi:hypothetical protein